MHLSILSDAFVSDRLADAGIADDAATRRASRAHWDGIMRGMILMGVFTIIIVLALLSNAAHSYETAKLSFGTPMFKTPWLQSPAIQTFATEADVPATKIMHRLILSHE